MKELVHPLDMAQDEAREKWYEYCTYLREHKDRADDTIRTLKDIYFQISQGRQVIDIYESFKMGGKNILDKPRLALARADMERVVFARRDKGAGAFFSPGAWEWMPDSHWTHGNAQVALPPRTFEDWDAELWPLRWWRRGHDRAVETTVPVVPVEYRPDGHLNRYFVLWEVDDDGWEALQTPPRDPFLLRRLSPNIFAVMAVWDLTELERAVMRGHMEV